MEKETRELTTEPVAMLSLSGNYAVAADPAKATLEDFDIVLLKGVEHYYDGMYLYGEPQHPTSADSLEVLRRVWQPFTQSNVDRMEVQDIVEEIRDMYDEVHGLKQCDKREGSDDNQERAAFETWAASIGFCVTGKYAETIDVLCAESAFKAGYRAALQSQDREDTVLRQHITNLTTVARMPNAEYVTDKHNDAVKYLRAKFIHHARRIEGGKP